MWQIKDATRIMETIAFDPAQALSTQVMLFLYQMDFPSWATVLHLESAI